MGMVSIHVLNRNAENIVVVCQREFCLSQTDQAARRACSSRCRPGFLCLLAVSNEPSDQMNHKIDGAAMASMLDLRNILELIDNGLDNRPFTRASVYPKGA